MRNVPSLIILLPLLGFLFNAFLGKRAGNRAVALVSPGVVLAAFVVALYTLVFIVLPSPDHRAIVPFLPFTPSDMPWISLGGLRVNFALLLDPLSMLMVLIVTGVGGLIHIYATGYMAEDREQARFFTYFNLFIFMMLVLVLGENFLLMFVGWEGVGTCSYLLVSFWYKSVDNSKAGNKAFIVNRVGDLGFSLGMMAIWSIFGTLSFFGQGGHLGVMDMAKDHAVTINHTQVAFANLPPLFAAPALGFAGFPALTVICILLFIGAMGKSAQIPLWVWLPDAMAGPTPVSALIHAATMVTAGVVMLTRCSWLFVQAPHALAFVAWIGVLTAFMGATIALVQNDIKRVLAFSTVSQLGYMFLACGVGDFTAGMFHVTTHAFFKALLFLGSGAVIHSMLGEQDMRKMGGLKNKIFNTWLVMAVATYAIAGFPFLSGFWSKDAILDSALRSPWGSGMILYGIGIVTAFMTAYYMNRLMWKTFYTDPRYVDGQLPEQHHGNDDAHDPHGAHAGHEEAAEADAAHASANAQPDDSLIEPPRGHGHVHESPPAMMYPLYVLAVLSVVGGLALGPTHVIEHFLEPSIAPLSLGGGKPAEEVFSPMMGYVISSIVAIGGLALAAFVYGKHKFTGSVQSETVKARNPIYRFLFDKWEFDAIYNAVFIGFGGWLADKVLWRGVDSGMIDGFVNGLAGVVGAASGAARKVQTGYVRNYALAMLFGVVALVVGVFYTWFKLQPH
jgi:NADH-quinone oxidoreductase subunit L